MKKGGAAGSVVIYIGGIAELFKSSRKEERLYLSKRKGFIKVRRAEERSDDIFFISLNISSLIYDRKLIGD